MGRWCKTIHHPETGQPIGIACGRSRTRECSVFACHAEATHQCDFKVERNGRRVTCDRWCCKAHVVSVGPDLDYCMPHARTSPALALREKFDV